MSYNWRIQITSRQFFRVLNARAAVISVKWFGPILQPQVQQTRQETIPYARRVGMPSHVSSGLPVIRAQLRYHEANGRKSESKTISSFKATAASAIQQTATPGTQIANLSTTISSFSLSPGGSTTSFTSQLQQVSIDLQGTGNGRACSDLSLFISHVKPQTLKQLTAAQAQQMLAGAAQIGSTLGCF